MPQILVLDSISATRAALKLKPIDFAELEGVLCESIAKALTVPSVKGAQLTADDVKVDIVTSVSYKTGANNLRILVFANDFKKRRVGLKNRAHMISDAAKAILPDDVKGFVYIRLAPAGFAEF